MMVTYSLASGLFVYDKENKPSGDPIEAIKAVAAAGFRQTELLAEGDGWKARGPRDIRRFRDALEQAGGFPHSIHTPFSDTDLASSDEKIRRSSIERIADAMRFLAELGGRTAIVHPTTRPEAGQPPFALESIGAAAELAHRSVSELVRVAEETGIRIALENLPNHRPDCRPLESTQELRAFIAAFPPKWVGICLDVGHSLISGLDPGEQAQVASERLYALHIQDGDGQSDRHWVPGQGVADWDSLGAALSDIGFDGAWTIEVLVGHTEATLEQVSAQCTAIRQRWASGGMSRP